jgi:hypothetical protein
MIIFEQIIGEILMRIILDLVKMAGVLGQLAVNGVYEQAGSISCQVCHHICANLIFSRGRKSPKRRIFI